MRESRDRFKGLQRLLASLQTEIAALKRLLPQKKSHSVRSQQGDTIWKTAHFARSRLPPSEKPPATGAKVQHNRP
jgi:hypothetical protein